MKYILLVLVFMSSISRADNPMFRRHIIWKYNDFCYVREWFVDFNGEIMTGEGDPDKFFYEPKEGFNHAPFCNEILEGK